MNKKAILITGDFVLDNHIYEGQRHHYGEDPQDGVVVRVQLGGAALVHQLLRSLLPPRSELVAAETSDANTEPSWSLFVSVKDFRQGTAINPSQQSNEGWLQARMDVDFEHLRGLRDDKEFYRDSNRDAAMNMLAILDLAGLQVTEGTASPAEEEGIRQHLEYRLDALAEAEHERWMAWYRSRGWRYKRDDEKATHPCLQPFRQLSKGEADKDRDSIRHYLDFARMAGMKIIFPREQGKVK